ncbi:MAG: hypothetical protein ACD_20C00317G0025 [uncultured bacterium]|nr:MAG: hypothetical protein ACD_20C00317G0025 [uncultured bacterium]
MYRKKLKAVSFAEIIIAVVILAVVAGFTIPTVIQDLQLAHYKALWKNFYTDFTTVHAKLAASNRGTVKNLFTNSTQMVNLYGNHLNYLTKCIGTSECWHASNTYYGLNGSPDPSAWFYGFVLNNGILIAMTIPSTDCSNTPFGIPSCFEMLVDVNGFKGPNTYGKDIFIIYVQEHNIKPAGCVGSNSSHADTCSPDKSGVSCSTEYLKQ